MIALKKFPNKALYIWLTSYKNVEIKYLIFI